ncbi:hypothetical protein GOODEAATRI_011071 [Goodea atripinnis]|uniref:Uncharacterized protein n=1 Tax=Goodea atripinnis TaxID=208336 RepID=A0ABV0PX20_9TELE
MIQVAAVLKTMAKDFSVAVLPGLGVSWSHVPRTRILLERVERGASVSCTGRRSATLIKSSRQVRHQQHGVGADSVRAFCCCRNILLKWRAPSRLPTGPV